MEHRNYDKYVFKIVEYGNLTKAAAALGISQPALSSGLTNMENELGFKIFNRRSIPITLTEEGTLYYEYISKLHVMAEDFRQRIDSFQKDANNHAIIGGPVVYAKSMVADTVMDVLKVHPDYNFVIKCSPLSELIELSSKGEVNCFICTSDRVPENFKKKVIHREKIYLCIPNGNPVNDLMRECIEKSGKPDYSVLDAQEFVFMEEGLPLNRQMKSFFERYGIVAKNRIVVDQVSTALNVALRGMGVCFASEEAMVGCDLSSVSIYPLPDDIFDREIYVAYDKELFMPTACKDFINHLINRKSDNFGGMRSEN